MKEKIHNMGIAAKNTWDTYKVPIAAGAGLGFGMWMLRNQGKMFREFLESNDLMESYNRYILEDIAGMEL